MTALSLNQLLDVIRDTQGAYYRLTIIAGPSGSGKTRLLTQIASQLHIPTVNLSLFLSKRLLSQTRRQRALKAQHIATEVIDEHNQSTLCLDNTELLFDSTLCLNPLVFFQDISRNRLVVASWDGALAGNELRYAYPGHPDFFTQAVSGYPVVTVEDGKLQLFLTS